MDCNQKKNGTGDSVIFGGGPPLAPGISATGTSAHIGAEIPGTEIPGSEGETRLLFTVYNMSTSMWAAYPDCSHTRPGRQGSRLAYRCTLQSNSLQRPERV